MTYIDLESFDNEPRAKFQTPTGENVSKRPSPYKGDGVTIARDDMVNRDRKFAKANVQPCVRYCTQNHSNSRIDIPPAELTYAFAKVAASDLQNDPTLRAWGTIAHDSFN